MTDHIDDELVALLSGELGRDATSALSRHLRSCEECRAQLVDIAVAHGRLRAAARAEDELRPEKAPLSAPAGQQPPWHRPARLRGRRLLVAAAAVIVIAAAAAGISLSRSGARPALAAVASLQALAAPAAAHGSVVVHAVGTTLDMSVSTEGLPPLNRDHFYEVWLLQPTTNKMLPVGILSPSGTGRYSVAAPVMAQFTAIDVSLQANNGDPAHSTTSVLRGLVHAATA
jgi:anti-sigma-K factor RskA